MKLSLVHERGVEIVAADGPITEGEVKVLRAGLSKILKTGKNKVILELTGAEDLPSAVIREIAAFDLLARELSGRVVLARITPRLQSKIDQFARPPVILCFSTREKALELLLAPLESKPVSAADIHGATPSGEGANLQRKVEILEEENQRLKEQLVSTLIDRRHLWSPAASEQNHYQETIRDLEAKIEELLTATSDAAKDH